MAVLPEMSYLLREFQQATNLAQCERQLSAHHLPLPVTRELHPRTQPPVDLQREPLTQVLAIQDARLLYQ